MKGKRITLSPEVKQIIQDAFDNGKSYEDIAQEIEPYLPNTTYNQRWHKIKNVLNQNRGGDPEPTPPPVTVEYNGTSNTTTYDGVITITAGKITPQTVLEGFNLDPREWDVVSYRTSQWEQGSKDGTQTLYASRVSVKPKSKLDTVDVERFFRDHTFTNVKEPVQPFTYNADDELLEIDYCDLHIGLLSTEQETGSTYNVDIARQRFLQTIEDIIDRSQGKHFSQIRFCTIGDILHIDTNYATTSGTQQDTQGRISTLYEQAVEIISDGIDRLLTLQKPIEYVYVAGNHDRQTGEYIARTLKALYRKNPNITFDVSPDPCKVKVWGEVCVGYVHGDMPQKNLGSWLTTQHRKEYGQCRFAEVHCGHLHNEAVKTDGGVIIRRLPSLCESSYWEHQQGYEAQRGLMCFVYNKTAGLRETWVYNI